MPSDEDTEPATVTKEAEDDTDATDGEEEGHDDDASKDKQKGGAKGGKKKSEGGKSGKGKGKKSIAKSDRKSAKSDKKSVAEGAPEKGDDGKKSIGGGGSKKKSGEADGESEKEVSEAGSESGKKSIKSVAFTGDADEDEGEEEDEDTAEDTTSPDADVPEGENRKSSAKTGRTSGTSGDEEEGDETEEELEGTEEMADISGEAGYSTEEEEEESIKADADAEILGLTDLEVNQEEAASLLEGLESGTNVPGLEADMKMSTLLSEGNKVDDAMEHEKAEHDLQLEQQPDVEGKKRKTSVGKGSDKKGQKGKKSMKGDAWVEPNYNSDDFISKPINIGDHVPDNILQFYDSYGYDSSRKDNLHMLDENTIVFIAGNYLHFYSITEAKVTRCRRSAKGYGLGHIALHPSKEYFAVGEKGSNPIIVVYKWPDLSVYRILKRGTIKGYSFVNFNPPGDLLCSQGMDPDYMLTIWDWAKEKILLRCKAFANDISKVTFSPTLPGDLTTCGVGHIRFWKMAETFTGLKLQGAIGRFGKTEISDIQDYVELPNGKVLSGCEWGNILVWDGGLIVCEICGMNEQTLHNGEITSLIMIDQTNEIITVGKDGYLRIWDVDSIDIADTIVDDSGKFVVEPTSEIRISGDAWLQGSVRNISQPPEQNSWFCQDSWGRVWDLSIATAQQNNEYSPTPLFYTPGGGPITCVACSVAHTIMVVGTEGGHLWIINYITKETLCRRHYKTAITKLFWLPIKYDPKGVTFLVAFGDGCIRSYSIQPITPETKEEEDELDEYEFRRGLSCEIGLNQVLRFCKAAITVMKFDEENEILYVCGDDRTLWGIYLFYDDEDDCTVMEPLAYYTTPFSVYYLDLHPVKPYRMILAGRASRVAEIRRPEWLECDTDKSFFQGKLRGRRWFFISGKSERRKMERREWRKVERDRRLKILKEEWKKKQAQGAMIDEDFETAKLDEEFRKAQHADDEDPIYKPEKHSRFLGIYYHINPSIGDENMAKSFFVQMADYDSGYIYECKCVRPEIGGFHNVPPTPPFKKDEDDAAVTCYLVSDDDEFLLFGMSDGSIRVMPKVDVQAKLAEMVRLEAEEATKRKSKELEEKERQELAYDEYTELETEATTAPPIPQDQDKQQKDKSKKKSAVKGGLPPFQPSIFPYDLENFFALPMHDPNRGAIREMAWSGDGVFLISVGEDGSIFSYRWDPDNELKDVRDSLPESVNPDEALEYEFLPDEEDANMLTVEESKKEEEQEKVRGLQEEFKEDVRSELRDLREVFRNIKQRNKEIPEQYRLTEEELKLPDEIFANLQAKLDEEIDEVSRIHEYETIQTILQLEKINKNFFEPLLYPHIVVKDISHTIETHTIRQKKLSQDFRDLIEKNNDIMNQEQVRSTIDLNVAMSDTEEVAQPVVRVYAKDIIGEYEHKLHTYNVETLHNIRHLERRLEERYYRELAWAELIKRKIRKDFVDPDDQQRLSHAKSHRGDFRLQASETFLGDHSTIAERRQKIIDMKLWVHETTKDYNKKVVDCRDEKIRILQECKRIEEKIKLVQPFLPPEMRRKIPPIYEMEPCEKPENTFEIPPEEMEREEAAELQSAGLLEFKEQLNEELYGVKRQEKPVVAEEEIKDFMAPSIRHTKSVDLEFENMTVHKYRKHMFTPTNDKERTRYEITMWPTLIKQEMLFKELMGIIDYFHNRVKYLHDYKIKMDIDLHIKNIGMMTLTRELNIAKEFETQELGILERLRVQKEQYHDARHKMDKVKKKMTKMNADVKKLEGELALIQKEVQTTIGEKGKWVEYLMKVFKKKVKLEGPEESKPKSKSIILMGQSSSEESEDNSESTSQDTGSDLYKLPKMKLDINVCPEHLDKNIYNKVCELRQRKAVAEVEIETAKKDVEKVAEDFNEMERVYKRLEGRLTDTGQDIRVLQRRRQKRMNELKCMVIMRLDQISCVDMDEVGDVQGDVFERLVKTFPGENKVLVFPSGETGSLEQRSHDLSVMTDAEKKRMKNGRQMELRLIEELKKAEKRVEELKITVKKDMVMKFGREVDLDKVTAAIINLELLDKEIQLDKLRRYHYLERQRVVDTILDAKDDLTAEIRENSNLKILKAMVIERNRDLDYFVWLCERENEKKEMRAASRRNMSRHGGASSAAISKAILRGASSFDTGGGGGGDADFRASAEVTITSEMEQEIKLLRAKVMQFEYRAKELRNALCSCKRKSGMPPVVPLDRQLQYQPNH